MTAAFLAALCSSYRGD